MIQVREILVCLVECSTSLSRAPTSHRLIFDNHLSHGRKGGDAASGRRENLDLQACPSESSPWSEPGIFVETPRALCDGHSDNRIPALPTAVRAIPVRRPLRNDPCTGV